MGTPQTESVMQTYLTEVVGNQKFDLIPEFTAAEMVDHTQPELRGPDALIAHARTFCGNIPDLKVEVLNVFGTDDMAVGIWRWHGTPTQPVWGRGVSCKPVIPNLVASVFRFEDGMLVEYRPFVDAMEIFAQLAD